MTRHRHADLIHAWAEGAEIESYNPVFEVWSNPPLHPLWNEEHDYRIKPAAPEKKPDVVITGNARLIFDGETGALKSAEVIK